MDSYKLPTNQFALIRSNRNITNFAHCVLELVLNSLSAQAMSIAIRIHFEKRKIQVIDNGIGINKDVLLRIGEYYTRCKYDRQMYTNYFGASGETLTNIRKLSSCLIITTRNCCSLTTYVKIFRSGHASELIEGEHRPVEGTTVTVFGLRGVLSFHQAGSNRDCNISAVRFIVAGLAMVYTKVSFSIRDDMEGNIIVGIGKIHNPLKVLELMCEQPISFNHVRYVQVDTIFGLKCIGYVGICHSQLNIIQYIFVNQRPVWCPVLEKLISETVIKAVQRYTAGLTLNTNFDKKKNIVYLLYFKCLYSEYSLSIKNGVILVEFHKLRKLLNCIETSINNAFEKNFNSSSKKVLYNNCKFKDYEITYPNCLEGEKIIKNEDVKACNLATVLHHKTSLPQMKQECIIRQKVRITRNRLANNVLPINTNNALNWEQGFDFPFIRCNYHFFKSKIKKSVFKYSDENLSKEYKKNFHTMKLFKYNLKWRKMILTYVTKHIYQSKKSNTLTRKEQCSKHLNAIRKNFIRCIILQKKRLIKRKIEQLVSVKEKYLTTEKNSSDEKFQPYNHLTMKTKSYVTVEENAVISERCTKEDVNLTVTTSLNTLNKFSETNKSDKVAEEVDFCLNDSDWSDWTYHNHQERPANVKYYDFLPLKLNMLLPYGHIKLTNRAFLETGWQTSNLKNSISNQRCYNINTIRRRQDLEVRPCKTKARFYELTLSRTCLNSIKVMRQINCEFIAASITQDNKEFLILVDQHAVDERIRYENLLEDYMVDGKNEFVSADLAKPIQIHGLTENLNQLLLANSMLLKQFGLSLRSGSNDSLLLTSIPKCLLKKRFYNDDTKMISTVRKLLLEIGENFIDTNVISVIPMVIHNTIATEACHDAIKFGDPLTREQCKRLMELLKDCKAPHRCAHGRPSFIPILELTELKKRRSQITKEKLNFASLRRTGWKEEVNDRKY